MTKREAAIVTAYTMSLIGSMSDFHELAEELLGRPIMTHEFADEKTIKELKIKSRPLFVSMEVTS